MQQSTVEWRHLANVDEPEWGCRASFSGQILVLYCCCLCGFVLLLIGDWICRSTLHARAVIWLTVYICCRILQDAARRYCKYAAPIITYLSLTFAVLRGVYSDTSQLNWTKLTQLNSVQPSQLCFCLWRHDLQTESTVVHAVELSSVEFSWVVSL